MLIQNFRTFVQTLRPYEIECGFGKISEEGYEMFYGFNKPIKLHTKNKNTAWQLYKENHLQYDKFVTKDGFIINEYIKKIRVYDNGGQTMDRYTIIYPDMYSWKGHKFRFYVGACETGQWFFQHGELDLMRNYSHLGKLIKFDQLHDRLKNMIKNDIC